MVGWLMVSDSSINHKPSTIRRHRLQSLEKPASLCSNGWNMVSDVLTQSTGLHTGQFRMIAQAGFGDGHNSYPHAMAWFKERLYVGTTRCVLALLYNRNEYLRKWPHFPIRPAKEDPYKEFDIRGQIWRFDPVAGTWEKTLVSPMFKKADGGEVPVFLGIRNTLIHRRPGDSEDSLYLMTWSPQGGPGPLLMRTTNGTDFERITFKGFAASQFNTFRPLLVFRDRFFTAPTGRVGSGNKAGVAIVLTCKDPERDDWVQANDENFGDPHNETIFEMIVFNDHLYAATMNSDGFQIWKTKAQGEPPYRWTPVLERGAGRGPINEAVASFCVFGDDLYIGTAITNGGYDRKHGIGPAPIEVLRLHADDSWELLVGDGRMTPQGLKSPLSGLGPGFDKISNTYVWRMCVHEGWLYAGTFSWGGLLPFVPRDKWPADKRRLLDPERESLLMDRMGGFDLWRTRDGRVWLPVTRNGFDNPCNYGVRTLVSTPHGLFVGTANPFGPEVAVHGPAGWRYETNARGGLEVWLGNHATDAEATTQSPPKRVDTDGEDAFIDDVLSQFFAGTDHRLFGWWDMKTRDGREASERLLDELLAFLPMRSGDCLVAGDVSVSALASLETRGFKRTEGQADVLLSLQDIQACMSIPAKLKPGGSLLACLPISGDIASELSKAGWKDVKVVDVTVPCWNTFRQRFNLYLWEKALDSEVDADLVEKTKERFFGRFGTITGYALVLARKAG